MIDAGLLPDNWERVSYMRYVELNNYLMRHLFDSETLIKECLECPHFRVYVTGNRIYPGCVFGNKCIKQYPHIYDNKEFK